ncbi:TadA family conjugal transfer-associated ATPase [Hoyosella rhizosphaerae]|uniref:Conjugal transfer protein n=1 Tax=Hoyosella rhizosphaerae TaxID=1755582 RepID=A0A916UKR9_9ACTN|nr:TadA family conjugal transfer-associated ATPase [Hoyosella rhizosphaerae]MBN4925353.1 TadA family conjugal transfer-associated ATPase [Hoyosella rhizosphaerae]GGC75922.1 conjugal transfer protein [Hoyosella rhizosphaerae]
MNPISDELLNRVRIRLADTPTPHTPEVIVDLVRSESGGVLGDYDILNALRTLHTELNGAGPLDDLLADRLVTDVFVNSPNDVWIDRGRGNEKTNIRFADEAAVRRLAQRLASAAGRRLDEAQPWIDGWLPHIGSPHIGVRLHALLSPLAADGTCISLRVLRPASHTLEDLLTAGMFPPELMGVLDGIVQSRLSYLITGGTGTGKTTLLSALLGRVPHTERIVCVEDVNELSPRHPHVVRMSTRAANIEGVGEINLRALVRHALRMKPDRLIVGEVRGAEVIDLLAALNTGHEGGAGTLHANSPAEVPARMEALAALGAMGRDALHSQLKAAVQVVLHVRKTGTRRLLADIGIVDFNASGHITVSPAWSHKTGQGPAWETLLSQIGRS